MHYFHWDTDKAVLNEKKHGVTFNEGATVFSDENVLLAPDFRHSTNESRLVAMGLSEMKRILFVVFTYRRSVRYEKEIYRIISVRAANKKERQIYLSQS